MFSSPAYAQAAGAATGGGMAFLVNLVPLALLFVIFYLLLIRPQQQRQKQHAATIAAVKKGDTVVTAGGKIGKITKVDNDEVEVEIAPNVRVRVVKATIAEVRSPGGKPAND
jgi:preprotein translocase subunit YajC